MSAEIRCPFKNPDKRAKFNSAIKAWQQKHSILFYPDGTPARGNAVAESFWRGFRNQPMGTGWDAVSKDTLAYIWFRAGQAARREDEKRLTSIPFGSILHTH